MFPGFEPYFDGKASEKVENAQRHNLAHSITGKFFNGTFRNSLLIGLPNTVQ